MDNENCAVSGDSLSLLEKEIRVVAAKPKDFYYSFISNHELFKKMVEHFQRSEIDVQRILSSIKTQGVTEKDIEKVLRLIKKEAKENSSKIQATTTHIRIKDYIRECPENCVNAPG